MLHFSWTSKLSYDKLIHFGLQEFIGLLGFQTSILSSHHIDIIFKDLNICKRFLDGYFMGWMTVKYESFSVCAILLLRHGFELWWRIFYWNHIWLVTSLNQLDVSTLKSPYLFKCKHCFPAYYILLMPIIVVKYNSKVLKKSDTLGFKKCKIIEANNLLSLDIFFLFIKD